MNMRDIILKVLEQETDGFKDEQKLAELAKNENAREKLLKKTQDIIDVCNKIFSENER